MKFSVIIALYNGEKFIDRTLTSLIKQSLPFIQNIEVIIIDDGSEDNSKQIVDGYTRLFPSNIKYYYKQNGGQGSARNYGLQLSNGEWVSFIDQDDFVHRDYFLTAYEFIYKQGYASALSIIWTRHIYFLEKTKSLSDSHLLKHCFFKTIKLQTLEMNLIFFSHLLHQPFFRFNLSKNLISVLMNGSFRDLKTCDFL